MPQPTHIFYVIQGAVRAEETLPRAPRLFFAVRDFSVRSLRSLSRNDRVGGRAGVSLCRNDTVIKNIIPTVSIAPFSVISTETNEVSEAEKSFFAYPA